MKNHLIYIFCLACGALFSQGIPYGKEFKVNTYLGYVGSRLTKPAIAALSDGGFIVCWPSWGDKYDYGIYGQLYNATSVKKGGEFQIDSPMGGYKANPTVTALPEGGFVVCWESGQDIYGQLYDESGKRKGEEFQVNSYTMNWQDQPKVAALSGGGFVVCWDSDGQDGSGKGVYGQLYDESGSKKDKEFQVNTYTKDTQRCSTIAALSGGGFVVCWNSNGQDGSSYGVYGQLFNTSGKKIEQEFIVNTYRESSQWEATVAPLSGGGFVVCWDSYGQDGSSYGIYGQLFDASGKKIGREFLVNIHTNNMQYGPTVSSLSGGGFVVCWDSYEQDGSCEGVYGQLYDESGNKKGEEFQVNNITKDGQIYPTVAALSGQDYVVSWVTEGQDSSIWGVYAKRFPENPIIHKLVPFGLLDPSNDSSIKINNPVLTWRNVSNQIVCYPWEVHFKIFVDDNSDFSSPVIYGQDKDTTLTVGNLQPGRTYFWKVLAQNIAGDSLWSFDTNGFFVAQDATSIETKDSPLPNEFLLYPNYPNPFNSETTIRFAMPLQAFVTIKIYDIHGKLIRVLVSESKEAGSFQVKWDSKDFRGLTVPSGIYLCRMEAKDPDGKMFVKNIKMGMLK